MIELKKEKYGLVIEPLSRLKINTLFARSVVEEKVSGKIYVDHLSKPKTFYIIHPYGMSLLFGNSQNDHFNEQFADYALNKDNKRTKCEWMQALPQEWDEKLVELFGPKLVKSADNINKTTSGLIELNTRINFKFNLEKYQAFKRENIKENLDVIRTNETSFNAMTGSVIPSNFWNNAADFCKNGIGFSLFHKGSLATTAYSAFKFDNELELGMETLPNFRGKGFAQYVCSALIDYCIVYNYEPIWACKYENTASYKLAEKLGFEAVLSLPYYCLNK